MNKQQQAFAPFEFDEMLAHYIDVQAALKLYFSPDCAGFEVRFFGESLIDIGKTLQVRLQEADQHSSLILLAGLEAAFRRDYQDRVSRRLKDDLSRSYRKLYKRKSTKVKLEVDLFERWKTQSVSHKEAIARLKSIFKFRHWMAHGRYWQLTPGEYTFLQFYDLAVQISVLMTSRACT